MTRRGDRRAGRPNPKRRRGGGPGTPARTRGGVEGVRPRKPVGAALEPVLRGAVLAGIGLVLLTPLVVTPATVYPFVVGKALWSRAAIEALFALWAVLALFGPAYRPPRSPLLVLLAAGLGVAVLSAAFGADFQGSMWSGYERMQGVVGLAHWLAFALVCVSVLRDARAWRALLGFNVAVGAAVALIVIAGHRGIEVPFYGALPEREAVRLGVPFGGPLFLGACMLVNMMVALGLAARAILRAAARADGVRRLDIRPWAPGLCWGAAALLHFRALALAGSVGSFVGLAASLGFVAVAAAVLAPRRWRAAIAGAAALGAVAVAGGLVLESGGSAAGRAESVVARALGKLDLRHPTVRSRLAAWETAIAGFAERPLLGWGPENFDTVFGRFASGYGAIIEPHDRAHGKVFEIAATMGALGLAAWLALWAATFLALWRALPGAGSGERALILGVGAAFTGHLVQSQALFDTTVSSLQHALLLAFVAGLGSRAGPRWRLGGRATALAAAALGHRATPAAAALAAVALAAAGLAANLAIYDGARAFHRANVTGRVLVHAQRSAASFEPLAGHPRRFLFNNATNYWKRLREGTPALAARVLGQLDREAAAAVAADPLDWRLHHALARMYAIVAETEPGYRERARAQRARARATAPNRRLFPRAIPAPSVREARPLGGGRLELRWQGADGVGYHVVGARRPDGGYRRLLFSWDPARTSFVPPAGEGLAPEDYAIKACDSPGRCGAWVQWPSAVPAAGAGESSPPARSQE